MVLPVNEEDLLKEVAYTYYYQGTQIQYDQKNSRRNLNVNPEDATAYREVFLDCSSYVNSVYNFLYGINIVATPTTANMDAFAKANIGKNSEVVYYIDVNDYSTDSAKEDILNEIWNNLQVGDLVCYRHNSSGSVGGHVMLYIGDNKFLHCTGSSFSYTDDPTNSEDRATTAEKNNGAIQLLQASELFINKSSSRYLFNTKSGSEVLTFEVLRPLNREGLELTDAAKARATIPYIGIEKTAQTPHMSTVTRGEEITYTISIKNNGTSAVKGIVIKDIVNDLCSFVECSNNGGVIGHELTWKIPTINAGETITVSYKVKVNNDATIGSIIDSFNATVNGVYTNKIYHTIGSLNASDYELLITKANELVGADYSSDTSDGFKMALDLYNNAFGSYFVNNSTTATNIVNELIYNNRENNTIDKTNQYYKLVNPDFYGGLLIMTGMKTDNGRLRAYHSKYFETGDIIVLYDSYTKLKKTYIFINDTTVIGLDSNKVVSKLYTTASTVENFVNQLIAYHRFVILRPSLNYNPN